MTASLILRMEAWGSDGNAFGHPCEPTQRNTSAWNSPRPIVRSDEALALG